MIFAYLDPAAKPAFGWPLDAASPSWRNGLVEFAFNEGVGSRVNDQVGTLTAPVFHGNVGWTAGRDGVCLTFPGATGDYVDLGNASTLTNMSSCTIAMWVYPTGFPTSLVYFLAKSGATGGPGWGFGIDNGLHGGTHQLLVTDLAGGHDTWCNATVPANTWTHVAATVSGGVVQTYVNGRTDLSNSWSPVSDASLNLILGAKNQAADPPGSFFQGHIRNLRIWGSPLPAAAIRDDFTAPWAGYVAPRRYSTSLQATRVRRSLHLRSGSRGIA
jgi:Concanavalin A-like lectin/glucanases superfamily